MLACFQRLAHPAWMGTLRRTTPISTSWGHDRGTPVDRYYIEQFLQQHRQDIRGRVLEVKDSGYTDLYGSSVEHSHVLDIVPDNPRATLIADLSAAIALADNQFDCFVLTQTLQFIFDVPATLREAYRILRPGGILLVTVPAVSRLDRRLKESDYWRFTPASCARLFGDVFGNEQVSIQAYGNVLTAMAFLTGMSLEELSRHELDSQDAYFPVLLAIRAVKR